MNFDDILGKLLPLFEQKMAFNMEMSKRAMSLEEKKEADKTDLEYRKLEAQITNEKDKLKWEKEKLTTAIKGDYDLQALKNNGMLDQKRLEGLDAKEKQKIMEEGANARAKLNADSETNKAYLTTLGTILGHAQEMSQTGDDGITKTSKPTAEVGAAAKSLMERTGLARPAAEPQARNVANEAEFAAQVIKEHEKAGTPDEARKYLNALPADTRQAALVLLNPGNTATPATGVAPASTPAPGMRTPLTAVTPAPAAKGVSPAFQAAAPTVEPVRQPIQPTEATAEPNPPKSFAAPGPLSGDGKTAFGGTPGGILGEVWKRGSMQAAKIIEQRKEEEEKNRVLRRARGLTVGGSF